MARRAWFHCVTFSHASTSASTMSSDRPPQTLLSALSARLMSTPEPPPLDAKDASNESRWGDEAGAGARRSRLSPANSALGETIVRSSSGWAEVERRKEEMRKSQEERCVPGGSVMFVLEIPGTRIDSYPSQVGLQECNAAGGVQPELGSSA
jgi:hypothetical protein